MQPLFRRRPELPSVRSCRIERNKSKNRICSPVWVKTTNENAYLR